MIEKAAKMTQNASMLRLEPRLELWLPTQPEYRMGYQKVIATLSNGLTERGIIVNSQVFLREGEYPWQMRMSWDYILKETESSSNIVKDVILVPREPETLKGSRQIVLANEKYGVLSKRKSHLATYASEDQRLAMLFEARELAAKAQRAAAESAPVTLTETDEIFKRFSAYANDKRITAGKGLTPGTFATTKEDADAYVNTGTDAVARYALPNSKPATNVFTMSPAKDTDVKRGTAQPAYNQPGGGVEVIFVNGLPDGTVTGPSIIPEK